jgi:hypothetical protein
MKREFNHNDKVSFGQPMPWMERAEIASDEEVPIPQRGQQRQVQWVEHPHTPEF